MGSIFDKQKTIKLESESSLDNVVDKLSDIEREQILLRKGQETFVYDDEVEEEIDTDEVPVEES